MTVVRLLSGDSEARACASIMAGSDPWVTLGRSFDSSLELVRDPAREVYVALEGGEVVGFVVVVMRGAFAGYVQSIGVHAGRRGSGLGSQLLAHAERRVLREQANVFLCVSSFNERARDMYLRSGYESVGVLHDYLVRGHDEWLLRKTDGPRDGTARTDGPAHAAHLETASLACLERGTGEPVVFVHGALGDFRTWSSAVASVGNSHRAISYSRRGHYGSEASHDGAPYDAATHATDLASLLRALDAAPAHLIGHSYGGEIAARVAAEHPELVRSLVLLEPALASLVRTGDPASESPPSPRSAFQAIVAAARRRDALEAVHRLTEWANGPGWMERMPADTLDMKLANWRTVLPTMLRRPPREFGADELRSIAAPTILIRGEQTTAYFSHIVRRVSELLPDSRAMVIRDSAHEPQWQAPDALHVAIASALSAGAAMRDEPAADRLSRPTVPGAAVAS